MSQVCPISFKQVDEKAARINALLSALSVVLFLVTSFKFIIVFLAIDFFIRGFIDPLYSFYSAISKSILRLFGSKPKLIDGSPKMFAAKLGFVFSTLIFLFTMLEIPIASDIIAISLVVFALLEGVLGFCIGCKVYAFSEKYKMSKEN